MKCPSIQIWVQFPAGAIILFLLFATASAPDLGPTRSLIQWIPGALIPGAERQGRKADHSPTSDVEVKNAWNYTSILPIRLHDVLLN